MSSVALGRTKKRLQTGTRDRLSELPKNVIEHILESMPIQDAVRTSALSQSWRYNWTTISKLIFDGQFYYYLLKKKFNSSYLTKCIVSDVLMVHNASISHFHLVCNGENWDNLVNIIYFLLRKGVKNLTLDTGPVRYSKKLPSHIFSFEQLTHLKIRSCHFIPPLDSTGLPNLIMLELTQILFKGVSFQHFITCCPKLESLTLSVTRNTSEFLTIYSTSLKHLDVRGYLHSIQISAEGLETVSLIPLITENGSPQTPVRNIFRDYCILPRIHKLSVGGQALQLLAAAIIPRKFPTLENMTLFFKFEDPAQVFAAVCLIRSTPNLQELEIWVMNCQDPTPPVLSSFGDDVTLSCLKIVKLHDFTGSDHELEMIKSIFACSPSLEKLFLEGATTRTVGGNDGRNQFIELMRFRRVSPKAEIIYSEPIF